MTLSQFSIFLLTFTAFGLFVVFVKRNRNLGKDVVTYSIGDKNFLDKNQDENVHKLLHVAQIVKKVESDDDLEVVEVAFPQNVIIDINLTM